MLRQGEVVAGRCHIEERLAVGGMGSVYRARHLVSRRPVALKLLHPHLSLDAAAVERFEREARASAEIAHDGIVQVLDAGQDSATEGLFLVMELLRGENLRERLSRTDITRGEGIALIDALLDPLAAAHERGFVHRDLKPENVFVCEDGRVKLLDFGIAKDLGQSSSATLTGAAMGTPHYMPPEQVMSSKGATPASDVWAVGVMLYEILSGAPPFVGPTPAAVVVRACTGPHAPLCGSDFDVGVALASVVDRSLAKSPPARHRDAAELRDALRAALGADPDSSHRPITLRPGAGEESRPDADTLVAERTPRPPESGRVWERVEHAQCSVSVPPGWALRSSSVPGTLLVLVDVATEAEAVPTMVRIKCDPWAGDTRAFADLGLENLARVAHIYRTSDATLAELPAVEVEALVHAIEPHLRTLNRCAAQDGQGWVAQASADPARFADAAPMFRAILGTFRLRS